jgi:hypothetical protein
MGRTACTEPQCLYKGALYLPTFLPSTQVRRYCDLQDMIHTTDLVFSYYPLPFQLRSKEPLTKSSSSDKSVYEKWF